MGYNFNKLPNWWVHEDFLRLKEFIGGGQVGESVASLKVLLALTTDVDYRSSKSKATYDYIEEVSGVSRPMIKKALLRLSYLGIIEINDDPENKKTKIYYLVELQAGKNWSKLPRDRVKSRLKGIPGRGKASLSALKIYITLLAFRTNGTRRAKATHETLRRYTGLQGTDIKRGLDILINNDFIHIDYKREEGESNSYELLGVQEEG